MSTSEAPGVTVGGDAVTGRHAAGTDGSTSVPDATVGGGRMQPHDGMPSAHVTEVPSDGSGGVQPNDDGMPSAHVNENKTN
jgi:hypothetical protein